jgi:cytochrome c biogenesis protein CcdA
MMSLLLVLGSISLLDSTSMVPVAVVPMSVILGGRRAVLGALSFLAGIFVVYMASGAVLLVGLEALTATVGPAVKRWYHQPNAVELGIQVVIGAVMVILGWKIAGSRDNRPPRETPDALPPGAAFVFGSSLMLAGMPGAFPYFGAMDQILRADLGVAGSAVALIFYNLVFLLPLSVLLLVRLIFPQHSAVVFAKIASVAERWGRRVIIVILVVVGLALVADGISFSFGKPLLPIGPDPGPAWIDDSAARNEVESIVARADVTVSDGLEFATVAEYRAPDQATFRQVYPDREVSSGIDGEELWMDVGSGREEAPSFVAGVVLGHQFHAQILFFERLNALEGDPEPVLFQGQTCLAVGGNGGWQAFFLESGELLGMRLDREDGAPITNSYGDWRDVDGIRLPFSISVDDGERVFQYRFTSVELR